MKCDDAELLRINEILLFNQRLMGILTNVFEIVNIFSASLPYYFQLKKFKETHNSEGYSLKVSFFVVTSAIIRIYFWFGKFFHWSLLIQAILLCLIHFWLVYEAVICKNYENISEYITASKDKSDEVENIEIKRETSVQVTIYKSQIKNILLASKLNNKESLLNMSDFFNWKQIQFYGLYIILLISVLSVLTEIFTMDSLLYVEFLGITTTIVEGFMAIPQVLEIQKTQNVDNLSVTLIASWFFGDMLKTYYFFSSDSPLQFQLLGIVQVSINVVLVYLFMKFKK